jgi:uncharacterized protein YkwD
MTRRLALQAVAALASSDLRAVPPREDWGEDRELARRIFSRINELRVARGAGELRWSEAVAECAREQSSRKVALRFSGHRDPERGDVADRLRTAGINWASCGENIFMERGWDDPVNYAVVFWWYSSGHQANILNPEFTLTGVGLSQGGDRAWFATQIFVTPPLLKTRGRF